MRISLASFVVVVTGLALSSTAVAEPWNPIGQVDAEGHPGVAVIPRHDTLFRPDDPWSETLGQRIYDRTLGPPALFAMFDAVWPVHDWIFNDFDNGIAKALADGCRAKYPTDAWRQISCASVAVEMFLDHHDIEAGVRSPCRSHQRAFAEVVNRLAIPGVRVSQITMPFHVLNRLTVTAKDGSIYQYAVDVGWNEDRLYPRNEAARRFHDRNGDGVTEVFALPPLAPRGANVARNAPTRAPGIVNRVITGIAAGAGLLRD